MESNATEKENTQAEYALARLRAATEGGALEGKIYLVGGALRDRLLGVSHGADLDLVLEGDAVQLARDLYDAGLSSHFPVLYPRFGTAMIHVRTPQLGDSSGVNVELITARSESYHPDSRKPNVRSGTLREDIYRRDFTINTLAQNLHTNELLDITGLAKQDIASGLIRTPVEPGITFFDDPLRMLRAVRFAARFRFDIEPATWNAIKSESVRLRPPTIALERIREEFNKIAMLPGERFRSGMALLLESGLLAEFMPEMLPMVGCTQGSWHAHDVWDHTMLALESLPVEAPLTVRLALLWHDIGKPPTRKEDERGVHFFSHPTVGAELVRTIMMRLKYSNDELQEVTSLVKLHMRLGEYRSSWEDPAVRRLIRDIRSIMDGLFTVTCCDQSAVDIPAERAEDLGALKQRIDQLTGAVTFESPLNGREIMELLGVGEGPHLKRAKEFLVNEVIDGRLTEQDSERAQALLSAWWADQPSKSRGD